MPDIKQVLNDEIRRLARKELKAALAPLVKQISEQRKIIADLKKTLARLTEEKSAASEKYSEEISTQEEPKKLRLTPAGIVKIRTKLKLSQGKLAALLGVSGHTVSLWEVGKVAPRANAKAAICALRGVGKKELKRRLAELCEALGTGQREDVYLVLVAVVTASNLRLHLLAFPLEPVRDMREFRFPFQSRKSAVLVQVPTLSTFLAENFRSLGIHFEFRLAMRTLIQDTVQALRTEFFLDQNTIFLLVFVIVVGEAFLHHGVDFVHAHTLDILFGEDLR